MQGTRQEDVGHNAGWRERPNEGAVGLDHQREPAEADPGEDLPRRAESDGLAGKRVISSDLSIYLGW